MASFDTARQTLQTQALETMTLQFPAAGELGPGTQFATKRGVSTATTIAAALSDDASPPRAQLAPDANSSTQGRNEGLGIASAAAPLVRGMPAAAATSLAPASSRRPVSKLSSKTCLAVLKRLKALGGLPSKELRSLALQAQRAAGKRSKADQEKAAALVGQVLSRASAALEGRWVRAASVPLCLRLVQLLKALEAEARQRQNAFDEAQAAVAAGLQAQADADGHLREAQAAEMEGKAELQEAQKSISAESKAILGAMAGKRSAEVEVAAIQGRKRQLEETVEKVYRPLKEAKVEGRVAGKQITELCKVGKKFGLHSELLTVAPTILRKRLDKRQTFDNLAVHSLDKEFTKHAEALRSKIQDGEQALRTHSDALTTKQAAVLAARQQRKECVRKLAQAKVAIRQRKEAVLATRKRVGALPQALNKAKWQLEQANSRVSKLRCGPLAMYTRVLPLPEVGEMQPQQAVA